jgi:predicted TIM-barrel fold metal-dependent hydrolase
VNDVLWTCSGDSHFSEPPNLYKDNLPKHLADRLPRSEKLNDQEEIVHIDGKQFRRKLPKPSSPEMAEARRVFSEGMSQGGLGATDPTVRLQHLDEQGVWAELTFPSLGLWYGEIDDPELAAPAAVVANDFVHEQLIKSSPRFVPTATLPLQSVEYSVKEAQRAAGMGFHAVFMPTTLNPDRPRWNEDYWEPLWAACEEAGLVVAWHIGTDASGVRPFKNPGGAMLNYLETTYGGQKAAAQMVCSGALERHPDLKVMISEGGATWVPFVGDRLNEAYRQHYMYNDGRITKPPKEYIMSQVYASFQHDETAVAAMTSMGYRNAMFGTDYPHIEGTFPHTQKVLHELLDGTDEETSERIRLGAFLELFPSVGRPPQA